MQAGYLSAEAYRALYPKKNFFELSFSDCNRYDISIQFELKRLFEDSNVEESLYFLEKIESDCESNLDELKSILGKVITKCEKNVSSIVECITYKAFLLDYIFCTVSELKSKAFITDENISNIIALRETFRNIYCEESNTISKLEIKNQITDYHKVVDSNNNIHSVSEPFEECEVTKGLGYDVKDQVEIDEDAVLDEKSDCMKYVLFLYGLDAKDFVPFFDYLRSESYKLSVRTRNGLKNIGYRNFYINYLFAKASKVLKVRNFGAKSALELDKIRQNIIDFVVFYYGNSNTENIEKQISKEKKQQEHDNRSLKDILGEQQYIILQKELSNLKVNVSVRCRNAIDTYKDDFIEDFVHRKNDVKTLQNIGRKTEIEFRYIIGVLDSIIQDMDEKELSPEEVLIYSKKNIFGEYIDDYAVQFLIENKHLPMFYILDRFLFASQCNRSLYMLNLYTPIFKDIVPKTLEEIASEANITRERVRQICVKANNILHTIDKNDLELEGINYSKILSFKDEWQYVIDRLKGRNIIEVDNIEDILQSEKCSLTIDFLLLVLLMVSSDEYIIVGADPLPLPTKFKKTWNNSYLIKRTLAESFDFEEMRNLIEEHENNSDADICKSATELLIDDFFLAWIDFDTDKVEDLSYIVSQILIQEEGLVPDIDMNFTIEGKKESRIPEIIYNWLAENGNPIKLEELYKRINAEFGNRYKSANSIRFVIVNDPRMCFIGMNGMVGLLEWTHVKIGSIRDIIVQYLDKFDEPQSIADIVKYVQTYRETTVNSIRSTMASGDQFATFDGGLYGLNDKVYPQWYYLSESERLFYKKMKELESFIVNHQRFPFSGPGPEEEVSLYRWWIKIKKAKNLTSEQKECVEKLYERYSDLPSTKSSFNWFDLCQRYKSFVLINDRKPSQNTPIEKRLNQWFKKTADDFNNGLLTSTQEKAYLNLCKSL